jgi:hypothetical protein
MIISRLFAQLWSPTLFQKHAAAAAGAQTQNTFAHALAKDPGEIDLSLEPIILFLCNTSFVLVNIMQSRKAVTSLGLNNNL